MDKAGEKPVTRDVLAANIMDFAKDSLLVSLRFMEPALSRLHAVPYSAEPCGRAYQVDGVRIVYDPAYVVASYAGDSAAPARDLLHMALHCIFRHQFSGERFSAPHWDLACDIAVESCIDDLGIAALNASRSHAQRSMLARMEDALPSITAETAYYYLLDEGVSAEEAMRHREAFFADDHGLWLRGTRRCEAGAQGVQAEKADAQGESAVNESRVREDALDGANAAKEGEAAEAASNPPSAPLDAGADTDGEEPQSIPDEVARMMAARLRAQARGVGNAPQEASAVDGMGGVPDGTWTVTSVNPDAQEQIRATSTREFVREMQSAWREIALRVDVAREDFAQLWGSHGGGFSQALKRAASEPVDYGEFLRRFVSQNEAVQMNDDEFDYLFYCYGFEVYGNMPLVEPLEYVDDGRIRDFVIAIDTSASTKGELVRAFVERTYDILHETKAFADTMNLHLVQCDAQIQEAVRIASKAELDAYLDAMELKGFGGTDFRPVFAYVDDKVRTGELANLKGLLYFTDGRGAYPSRKPPYEVAFALNDAAYFDEPDIPAWALRVRLDSGEFRDSIDGKDEVSR